jgi:hypothetical protein
VLPGLVALVRGGAKEKVVRVGLLATAVLLQGGPPDVAPDLLDLGLHKLVAVRALQVTPSWGPLGELVTQHIWASGVPGPAATLQH